MLNLEKCSVRDLVESLNEDDLVDSSALRDLYEETMAELKTKSWATVAARVKRQKLRSEYIGVTKDGVIRYKTTSGTIPGKWWYQEIYFEDLPDVIDILQSDPKFPARDALLLAMRGNVKVHCDDPSWRYWGWQYIGTKRGYALRRERRYPKIRNPGLTGSTCKHLLSVFGVILFDWARIVRDLRKRKIIPKYRKRK